MPLDITTTVNDIKTAMDALPPTASEDARLTAFVTALYTRLAADVVVSGTATVTSAPGSAPVSGTIS